MIGRDKIQFILFHILLSPPLSYFFEVYFFLKELDGYFEKVNFNIKFLYFKFVN
jgi:hypothetical protein